MRQWRPERLQLAHADPLGQREDLLVEHEPLVQVRDVQQRGVPALQRGDERLGVADPPRHLQRRAAERERALLARPRSAASRRAAPARARASGALARRPSASSASSSSAIPSRSTIPASAWRPAKPERGARPAPPRPTVAPGQHRRARERVARAAGCPERASALPSAEQQLAAARRSARAAPQRLQRAPVVPGRLLAGEHRRGLLGRRRRRSRSPCPSRSRWRRLEEVVRELGRRRRRSAARAPPAPARSRSAPHPPRRALALVQRLAHQRVREHEAVDVVLDLADQPGVDRLLQGGDEPLDRLVDQRLEHLQPELAPDHRRDRQRPASVSLVEPREPPRDHLLDALGHAERRRPRSSSSTKNGLPSVSACRRRDASRR